MRKMKKAKTAKTVRKAVKKAVLQKMAGPLFKGGSPLFQMAAYGILNGYSLSEVEREAEEVTDQVLRKATRRRSRTR